MTEEYTRMRTLDYVGEIEKKKVHYILNVEAGLVSTILNYRMNCRENVQQASWSMHPDNKRCISLFVFVNVKTCHMENYV